MHTSPAEGASQGPEAVAVVASPEALSQGPLRRHLTEVTLAASALERPAVEAFLDQIPWIPVTRRHFPYLL